jgi:hypothetical protein
MRIQSAYGASFDMIEDPPDVTAVPGLVRRKAACQSVPTTAKPSRLIASRNRLATSDRRNARVSRMNETLRGTQRMAGAAHDQRYKCERAAATHVQNKIVTLKNRQSLPYLIAVGQGYLRNYLDEAFARETNRQS